MEWEYGMRTKAAKWNRHNAMANKSGEKKKQKEKRNEIRTLNTNIFFARTFHIRIDQTQGVVTLALAFTTRTIVHIERWCVLLWFRLFWFFIALSSQNYGNKLNIVCVCARACVRYVQTWIAQIEQKAQQKSSLIWFFIQSTFVLHSSAWKIIEMFSFFVFVLTLSGTDIAYRALLFIHFTLQSIVGRLASNHKSMAIKYELFFYFVLPSSSKFKWVFLTHWKSNWRSR